MLTEMTTIPFDIFESTPDEVIFRAIPVKVKTDIMKFVIRSLSEKMRSAIKKVVLVIGGMTISETDFVSADGEVHFFREADVSLPLYKLTYHVMEIYIHMHAGKGLLEQLEFELMRLELLMLELVPGVNSQRYDSYANITGELTNIDVQ